MAAPYNPEKIFIDKELYAVVQEFVQGLPPRRRSIFMMVKEEGMKYQQVAELLEISVKTVELQMSLALKAVRQAVSDYKQSKDVKVTPINRAQMLMFLFMLIFFS